MRLYAITDRRLLTAGHQPGRLSVAERDALLRLAARWAAAGVDWVQLREKDLTVDQRLTLAGAMAASLAGSSTRLLVNGGKDMLDVASPAAAGVHLASGWTREQVAAGRRRGAVSVACHSIGEVMAAQAAQADIALLSPIFPTSTHPGVPGLGLATLRQACESARGLAVYALGGVDQANASACIQAGAAGVAGIRMFLSEAVLQR